MKSEYPLRHISKLAIRLVALTGLMALVACGTLEVSFDQTPEPPLATGVVTRETTSDDIEETRSPAETTNPWLVLENYRHPTFGYQIPVPQGAPVLEGEDGENTTYFSNSGSPGDGDVYLISVQVLPEAGRSAQQLVEALAAEESDVPDIEVVDAGSDDGQGALITYSGGPAAYCSEVRMLLAAFVDQGFAYVLRLANDGPERCDASKLPEVQAVVQGFQLPEQAPILAMTPTPTPVAIDDLAVAYTRDNNVWLWTESDGERQLTKDGGVDQVLLSDDKRIIAFRRGNGLWAVNADGSDERQLVKESDLPLPTDSELAEFVAGIAPYQVAWTPGSHQLMFNTSPQMTGPGLFLSDDLWLVDADNLALTNLFPAGEGGNFVLAPDGRQAALISPNSISVINTAGQEKREVLGYTPVATYSEFQYYARPVWSVTGDALAVIIPPPDALATEIQPYSVWLLTQDSPSAGLVGTIEVRGGQAGLEPVISPSLSQIAYVSNSTSDPDRKDLLFVDWDESLGDPTFYTSWVESSAEWSPSGQRFSFNRPPSEVASISAFTGRLGEEPRPVGNGESPAINVRWVDDDAYLYLQASARGWDLLLTDIGGTVTPIAGIVGQPPAFDGHR